MCGCCGVLRWSVIRACALRVNISKLEPTQNSYPDITGEAQWANGTTSLSCVVLQVATCCP